MTEKDAEQLRLLSVFHYVAAGLQAVAGCFPILHFLFGAAVVFSPETFASAKDGPPPALAGWLFLLISGAWILGSWTIAAALVVVGRSLARRRRYLFCLMADGAAAMMCFPLGTALGALTIIVLVRPQVKAAFEAPHAGASGALSEPI